MRVHVSIRSLISSTPLGIGGGDAAATANRSSTVDLQVFDAHYRRIARAKTLGVKARRGGLLRVLDRVPARNLIPNSEEPEINPKIATVGSLPR
jgi:hypothetical protein